MYSQPQQQQQAAPRPNRSSFWHNRYKNENPGQPDFKGSQDVSADLICELYAALQAGQYEFDKHGRPIIKVDCYLYNQAQAQGNQPVVTGGLETLAQTRINAAKRAEAKARYEAQQGGYQQPMQPQHQQPAQAPQTYPQQQPQPVYQQPPAPAPMPQQPVYQQPPAPQQQAFAPVYQQPPAQPAPLAPPMAGAIHGQPPAQPAPQLPANF